MHRCKCRVLIVTGIITSEHDPKMNAMLRRTLESTGRFEVKITEAFKGATAETLEDFDLILLNYDGKKDVHSPYIPLGDTAVKTICDFVANGGGIVFYHSAAISQEELYPREFIKMTGVDFKVLGSARKNPKLAFRVDTVENTKFSEGMPPYWYTAQDDLFVNLDWLKDTNVDVIATVMDEESDYDPRMMQKHLARDYEGVDLTALPNINKPNPVIWTNTYGKGRVFVTAIGHGADTIKRPAFCCLLARGCEWACSGEITIPYPDIQEERRFAAWPYYDNVSYAKVAEIMEGI